MGIQKGARALWYSELSQRQLGSRLTVSVPRWTTGLLTPAPENTLDDLIVSKEKNDVKLRHKVDIYHETPMGSKVFLAYVRLHNRKCILQFIQGRRERTQFALT